MAAVNPLGRQSVLGLKDIVRLVEDDLARVEDVFRSQVRSDVRARRGDRPLHPGGRREARPPGPPAPREPAVRLPGRAGGHPRLHRRVHPHREPPPRRHHRRGHHPPRPPQREQPVGQRHHRPPRRLPLHEVDGDGPLAGQPPDPAAPLRRDPPPHRGGDPRDRAERRPPGAPEDHLDTIRRKTADLFAACTRIGAILGGVEEEREEALARYGLNLGLCFQMVDDLLDFTAEEKTLGKPVANDLREGKVTLPMIFLIRRAGKAAADKVKAVLDDRAFARVTRDELVRMARECGALEEARAMAERYADLARRDLLAFDPSPYREALDALPGFILARDH